MAIKTYSFLALAVVLAAACGGGEAQSQSLAEQCAPKLPEVMTCVSFASGKESTPPQKCCDSVTSMKESNPACLCFLIQQIHNGTNPTLQKMNIQESRLLQLPEACKLANASISDCPKLLKLPANSPDAAIFKSNGTNGSPTIGGSTSSPSTGQKSHGFKLGAPKPLIASMLFLIVYVFSKN